MSFYMYLMLLGPLADFYIFVWSKLPMRLLFSPLHDMWAPRHLLPPSLLRPPSPLQRRCGCRWPHHPQQCRSVAAGRITRRCQALAPAGWLPVPATSPCRSGAFFSSSRWLQTHDCVAPQRSLWLLGTWRRPARRSPRRHRT